MLPETIQHKIVNRIVKKVSPLKIILFGSYASDSATAGSDIDLIIVKEKVASKIKESAKIWNLLGDIPIPKDIIVVSRDEYNFYKEEAGSVFRTANEKGIELYVK